MVRARAGIPGLLVHAFVSAIRARAPCLDARIGRLTGGC